MKAHRATLAALCMTASFAAFSLPAFADSAEDIAAIRAEMRAMQQDYEARLRDMDARLRRAEAKAETQASTTAPPVPPAPPVATGPQPPTVVASSPPPVVTTSPRAPASASGFNPALSVILNATYGFVENDPDAAGVPGFVLDEEAGLPTRGFSLGESEVALTANVDQEIYGALIVAFTPDGAAEVEEAYIRTTSLGGGFTLKGGRFFSGIGYLNERHAHVWDFSDAPLPYRVLLGNQYGDDGVQARWLAPVDIFLEFGAEWFRGDSFPAGNADDNGGGTYTFFVHAGDDIDDSSSWLGGLSFIHTKAVDRDTDGDVFTGSDGLAIASLVYKWAPNGNPLVQNLVVSGEYFFGNEQGSFNGVDIDLDRSGWYLQAVYQFMPRWRIGLRHDEVSTDSPPPLLIGSVLDDLGHTPQSTSVLLEFDTSEFGRFRLQYNRDESDLVSNNEIIAQFTVSLGAHGAHSF